MYFSKLSEKWKEATSAVLPIILIVLVLSFTIAPLPNGTLLAFIFGGLLLVVGMMFFTLGSELAMEPMGEHMGAKITKTKNLTVILAAGFLLGVIITISEPDLQVLANQVQSIPNRVLILSVAAGVGLFLLLAFLRMFLRIPLQKLLLVSYIILFVLAYFAPKEYLAVAFDSGGVTTGPMTVPFIMAFGIGICTIRSDADASKDSFGLIALCSVGPILAVLLLSIIYRPETATYSETLVPDISHSIELGQMFLNGFPSYIKEIAVALLPIVGVFFVFQVILLHLNKAILLRIISGLVYTYLGLVLFLTGANVGFMPAGSYLGGVLSQHDHNWIIVPISMLIGYFIVKAEPAVYVLERQVEEITDGAISGKALGRSLSIGVAVSVGLSMMRVLTGISVMTFLIPGYCVSLALSFIVPPLFTAVAFDSGGVASGPMTVTFLLPLAMGACTALGGNVVTDAFGVVAMVAMTPLITIQGLGLIFKIKQKSKKVDVVSVTAFQELDNFALIEL